MPVDTAETKISASQIYAKLEAIHQDVKRQGDLFLNPNDLRFHRASTKDVAIGKALKVDLRLTPVYNEKGYLEGADGGLFVEIVPQATLKQGKKDATFAWDSDQRVAAKLGIPDITSLLLAIESRWFRMKLPEKLLAKDKFGAVKPGTVGMFHKFEREGQPASTTTIEYAVRDDGTAMLLVTKSAELRKDFQLSLAEEIQLKVYLEHALRAMQAVGA